MCITNPVNRRASLSLKAPPHALLGGFTSGTSSLPPLPQKRSGDASLAGRPVLEGIVDRDAAESNGVKRRSSTRVYTEESTISVGSTFGTVENCLTEKPKSPRSSRQFYVESFSSGISTRTHAPGSSTAEAVSDHGVPSTNESKPVAAKETSPASSSTKPPVPAWLKDNPEQKPKPRRRRKPQKPGKTAMMNDRHFVKHNYHDHADEPYDFSGDDDPNAPITDDSRRLTADGKRRGGVIICFPQKLHLMLDQIEADGLASVISWQPHGRAFTIHRPKEFTEHVMPKYFRQTKLTSFQRQLNLYGFARLTRGADNGAYYHELFLRGRPKLGLQMTRTKVKGTGFKAASSPDSEPDFYAMKPVVPPPKKKVSASSSSLASSSDGTPQLSDDDSSKASGASSSRSSSSLPPVHSIEVDKPLESFKKALLLEKALRPPVAVLGQPQPSLQGHLPSQAKRLSDSSLGSGSGSGSPPPETEVITASMTLPLIASPRETPKIKTSSTEEKSEGDCGPPRLLHNLDPFRPIPFTPDRAASPSAPSSSHYHNATRTKEAAVNQSMQSATSSSTTTTTASNVKRWHGNCDFAAEVLKTHAAKSNLASARSSFTTNWANKNSDECLPLMSSSSNLFPISPVQRHSTVSTRKESSYHHPSSSTSRSSFASSMVTPSVCPSSPPAASLALLGERGGAGQARCDGTATNTTPLRPRLTPRTVSSCSEDTINSQGCCILDEVVNELLLSGNQELMCDFVHDWNPNPIQQDVDMLGERGDRRLGDGDDEEDEDEEMSDAILGHLLDEFLG